MECGAADLHIEIDPKIVVNLQHRDISTNGNLSFLLREHCLQGG